jgi:phage/plasmid-associated DNA primase
VKDFSEGFFRRFLILTFNRSFTKDEGSKSIDSIVASMQSERAEIIMWCMMGAMMLVHRGRYEIPASGNVAQMDWRVEADSVLDFIVSCCERREEREKFEYFSTVYEDFKDWCHKTGRKPMGHRTFGKRLVAHDVMKEKIGGQSKVGLHLKPRINWADWGLHH